MINYYSLTLLKIENSEKEYFYHNDNIYHYDIFF